MGALRIRKAAHVLKKTLFPALRVRFRKIPRNVEPEYYKGWRYIAFERAGKKSHFVDAKGKPVHVFSKRSRVRFGEAVYVADLTIGIQFYRAGLALNANVFVASKPEGSLIEPKAKPDRLELIALRKEEKSVSNAVRTLAKQLGYVNTNAIGIKFLSFKE
jgi:hypothetical protein